MLKSGTYLAKPKAAAIGSVGAEGKPVVKVLFETEDGEVSWTGWLTPKTVERTMGALILLGFKGTEDDFASLSLEMLDTESQVEIVVQVQVYQNKVPRTDKNGVPYMEVEFINRPGGAQFRNTMAPAEVKNKLSGLGIGAILASKRTSGPTLPKEDLPF